MMLAVLPLSLNFERLTSKYYDSPNVIISVSQLNLHSVPQSLCFISLTFYNYDFSVDQLSQNTETNYHHYLQLFFTFSLSFLVFWLSLPVSKMYLTFVLLCHEYTFGSKSSAKQGFVLSFAVIPQLSLLGNSLLSPYSNRFI